MILRYTRAGLRCARLPRRPYCLLAVLFVLTACFYLTLPYLKYVLHLSTTIKFIGDLSSDSLQMAWSGTRTLRDFIRPDEVTELSSPRDPYCSKFVILVTTIVSHYEQRSAIRDTWGQKMDVYFFLGRAADEKVFMAQEKSISEEKQLHEDIIVEDFIESYYNLTLKTAFMLKWAYSHCPDASYVMKTDDDMYLNPRMLMASVENIPPDSKNIVGYVLKGNRVHRDPESKWYLPRKMYTPEILPDYISGTAYVMTGKAMRQTYKASLDAFFISLEDILFTGILAKELNITLVRDYTFTETKPPSWNVLQWLMGTSYCGYRQLAVAHRIVPNELRTIWTAVNDPKCDKVCDTWLQTNIVTFMKRFL